MNRLLVRGISLIEAMVAVDVMAFGMLAVVGLQVTLRTNGDVSKQRAEAVRIAQQSIEDWRGISGIEANADPAMVDYTDLVNDGPTNIVGANATFAQRVRAANLVDVALGSDRKTHLSHGRSGGVKRVEERIKSKRGLKSRSNLGASLPKCPFDRIKRIIGHRHRLHPGKLKDALHVLDGILVLKILTNFG